MLGLTPSELYKYFQVNFIPISIIPDDERHHVQPLLDQAKAYYETSSLSDRGHRLNRHRCLRIPPKGIAWVPDYLYLKVIHIKDVPQVGIFASRPLSKGTWIGNYAGELLPIDHPTRSLHSMGLFDHHAKIELQVDSKTWGNHSYQPNVIRKRVFFDGMYHVLLYTLKAVEAHEQLLYNYGKDYWEKLGLEPAVL